MTHILSFDIDPIAKGRPQFSHHAFTPTRTRNYENAISVLAREQFQQDPFTSPIKVSMTFYMPTRFEKRWGQPHTFVPDADNLAKSATDALKGIVWKDDSAIAILVIEKVWAKTGSVEVAITELEPLLVSRKVIAASDLVFKKLDAKIAKDPKLKKIYDKAVREVEASCAANETISGEDYLRRTE